MKLRPFIAALLTFWLIVGPVGTAWAAYAASPCESMGSMSQPLPKGDCCGDAMDAAACLSACMATSPAAATPAVSVPRLEPAAGGIPSLSLRYATVLAPPDIAPPKTSAS
jgi:hypothetical protein